MKKLVVTAILIVQFLFFGKAISQSQNYSSWEIKASDLTSGALHMSANETRAITFSVTISRQNTGQSVIFPLRLTRLPSGSSSCGCTPITNSFTIETPDFNGGLFATREFTVNVTAQAGSSLNGSILRNNDKILLETSGPWSPNKQYNVVVTLTPGVPTNLQTSSVTPSSVGLTWTQPGGTVTGYKVYKNDVLEKTVASTSATVTGLTPSTQYSFKVSAYNSNGESPKSSPLSVTTSTNPITNNYIYYPANFNIYRSAPSDIPVLEGSVPQGASSFIYSWQVSNNGGTSWFTIQGEGNKDFDPPVISQETSYRRIVNGFDASQMLTFYFLPPIENNTICCNQTVNNSASPNPLTGTMPTGGNAQNGYCWQTSTDGVNWTSVYCGTGGPEMNQYQPQAGQDGIKYYRRVVTSQAEQHASNPVQVTFINVIPSGSNFANPFPVGTYTSNDCSYFTQTANSQDAGFSNVYGDARRDLVYSFTINYVSNIVLLFRTCNSSIDTKLYLLDSNMNLVTSAENGSDLTLGCGSSSQQADLLTSQFNGLYYLVVEGDGSTTLNVATALYGDCFDTYPQNLMASPDAMSIENSTDTKNDKSSRTNVELHPNPVKDKLTVTGLTGFQAMLYDPSTLIWYPLTQQDGVLDLYKFKKGNYILRLKTNDQEVIRRIAKE